MGSPQVIMKSSIGQPTVRKNKDHAEEPQEERSILRFNLDEENNAFSLRINDGTKSRPRSGTATTAASDATQNQKNTSIADLSISPIKSAYSLERLSPDTKTIRDMLSPSRVQFQSHPIVTEVPNTSSLQESPEANIRVLEQQEGVYKLEDDLSLIMTYSCQLTREDNSKKYAKCSFILYGKKKTFKEIYEILSQCTLKLADSSFLRLNKLQRPATELKSKLCHSFTIVLRDKNYHFKERAKVLKEKKGVYKLEDNLSLIMIYSFQFTRADNSKKYARLSFIWHENKKNLEEMTGILSQYTLKLADGSYFPLSRLRNECPATELESKLLYGFTIVLRHNKYHLEERAKNVVPNTAAIIASNTALCGQDKSSSQCPRVLKERANATQYHPSVFQHYLSWCYPLELSKKSHRIKKNLSTEPQKQGWGDLISIITSLACIITLLAYMCQIPHSQIPSTPVK